MQTTSVGHKIRTLREKRAWTQEQLAGAAQISPRTVQRAEEGVMSAETKAAIAGALDVKLEKLAAEVKPVFAPVLVYEDSRAAMDWLVAAFGFSVREKMTDADGQVIHGELVLDDGLVVVTHVSSSPRWASPKSIGKNTQFIYALIGDVDAHHTAAKKAGAKIVTDLETSYGHRRYRVLDLEGHEWCFAEEITS
jgi:uncharacterized glyoxalase superfamily protein PhnB/DNA-binding XRE family transcriptional regulator